MYIVDYINEYGHLSLNESFFNEVDNMAICQMGYTKIDPYFETKDSYTIEELYKLYFSDYSENQVKYNRSFVGQSPFVLKAMANSNRFKNAVVTNFRSKYDESIPEQYCSFEVLLDDNTSFIVFRGTDETLNGWKESFELLYKEIPGEKEALDYLKSIYNPNKKYRIGGHSKGGALASYSTIMFPEMHKSIINVYSNDGVGLNPKILPSNYHDNFKTLNGKFIKIIPEHDFFGALFSSSRNKRVIKADAVSIMQHDAMKWMVKDNHFINGTIGTDTLIIRDVFENFVKNVSDEEFKQFIDIFVETIHNEGLSKIDGVKRGVIPIIIASLKNIDTLSDSSKKIVDELINALSIAIGKQIDEDKKIVMKELSNINYWRKVKNKKTSM